MGFQPWVPQEDTNTEIRVAMLLSLILQIALIFLGPMRKRSSFPRFIIWSCYLLADWVADLALGLLLNNMGNIGGGGNSSSSFGIDLASAGGNNNGNGSRSSGSPVIFAFWTPFLLLHLGGPDTITAYSVEDNELWLRHLIGLLFEFFSAAVIFFCSLRSNPMIGATVLMFIAGIVKYGERTYSLYSGSIKSFRANILGPGNPGPNYEQLMSIRLIEDAAEQLVEAYDFFIIFRRLFVDLILNSKQRRMSRAFFLLRQDMNHRKAFEIIESELDFVYDMVYTKAIAYTWAGWVIRSICTSCIVSATVTFFFHDKSSIKRVDVGITYALLLGGLALDMAALTMLLFSNRASVFFHKSRRFKWLGRLTSSVATKRQRWSQSVSQFNLISYASGEPDHYKGRLLLAAAKILRVEEVLEELIFVRQEQLGMFSFLGETTDILSMAFARLRCVAQNFEHDKIAEEFNYRGSRVLDIYADQIMSLLIPFSEGGDGIKIFQMIKDRVAKITDFDESLLLWHITTDLCEFNFPPQGREGHWRRSIGTTLSEYMMYLLIKQPEMLSARTGIWLMRYQDTCAEARRLFVSMDAWIDDQYDARRVLLNVDTSVPPASVNGGESSNSVLFDACILAKALRELDELDDELIWKVLVEVWLDMLMYAARKCPGSTHVRQLNRGGELITLIWLLMEHMGLGEMYDDVTNEGTG